MVRINQTKNTQNFNGLYNNKFLLKSLEYVSEHGASVAAGASLFGATILRPIAISATPKAKKENKKVLSIESLTSAMAKFAVSQAIALPIEAAIKKIDENPKQFLNENTIKNLSNKDYKFLTQTIKLASGLVSAIPKSILGVSLIPIVLDLLSKNKKEDHKKQNDISFKGLPNALSKIINSEEAQKFAKKYSKNDEYIAKNMSVLTDVLLTTTSIFATKNSKKIKEEQKKPLMINKFLSSAISILAGCKIDELIKNGSKDIVEKFIDANKNSPKLAKYIEGINILRPTLVFAMIYYAIIPIISTFASDKLSQKEA